MPSIPADLRKTHWTDERGRRGTFVPNTSAPLLMHSAVTPNPATKYTRGSLAARFFVGLSVAQEPRWTVDDVARIVLRVRSGQTENVGASFLTQRGLYTSSDGSLVDEQSVQVILIDEEKKSLDDWTEAMVALGEALASELQQEVVILEIQRSGVVRDTYGIKAP